MLGLDGKDVNQSSTSHSSLNLWINRSRHNEQVVSQPFLFCFGFSSPPLDKFPSFLLSFPFFLLFIYLFIYFFVFLLLFNLFPFHHLFFFFFKFLFRPFLLLLFLLIQFIFLLFLSFYLLFLLFLLFLLEWEKITEK